MRRIVVWMLMAGAMGGCASLGIGSRADRPLLVVEGRTWNAPILNPDPPVYGLEIDLGTLSRRARREASPEP